MSEVAPFDKALPVRLTVGVTAHRDIPPAEKPGIARLVGDFFDTLALRFPDTPLQALCPLAEGGERIFAHAAIERGIPLVVPLPLPREYYEKDFADAASREEFEDLCARATVFELPLRPGVAPEQIARHGELRDSEYAQLGVFVSSHAQILVAMWDGRDSDQLGGTAQIVGYRLHNIYPRHGADSFGGQEELTDDENDLTYHIVCSRERRDGAPAPPLRPLQTAWMTGSVESQRIREMPRRYADMFELTEEFNRDLRRRTEASYPLPAGFRGGREEGGRLAGIRQAERMFAAADQLANHYQARFSRALRATYILAALMGAAFVGYSTLPGQQWLLYLFLGLFALGFGLYISGRRGEWHRKYLDYRVLAEGLRVQYYWAIAGVGNAGDGRFVYENFLQTQDPELGWIRHVMRDVTLRAVPLPDTGRAGLDFVQRHWVGDPGRPDDTGQLGYYIGKAGQCYRLHRLTERLGTLCLWSGIVIAVVLALLAGQIDVTARTVLLLLLGLLPLIAAVRGAYAHKRADRELIKQYGFMARIFRNARKRLDAAGNDAEIREILHLLGKAALDEHAEWILMHRDRPLEQSSL